MAKEGFLGSLGRFASQLVDGAPEGPRNVLYAIGPWINELTKSAGQQWLPHLLLGIPCEVVFRDPQTQQARQCAAPSIAACIVCKKPTCLDHSCVSRMGQAVCFGCVKQGIDDHAPKIPWPKGSSGNPANSGAPADPPPPPGQGPHADPPPPPPASAPLDARLSAARKVLRVKRSATFPEVQAAYKREALKWHPDRNPAPHARERFIAATAAYDLLKKAYEP